MDASYAQKTGSEWNCLLQVLISYLLESKRCLTPGCDGMTVDDVVKNVYPEVAGHVPTLTKLARRHGNQADLLAIILARNPNHASFPVDGPIPGMTGISG